jgi:hypothetical protein
VSEEDVYEFGELSPGEEILSTRPRFAVNTERRLASLYARQISERESFSVAGLTVKVEYSEVLWILLGGLNKYVEWRLEGGCVLDFRGADRVTLLKILVDK